jgi:hypothetical protein
VNSSTSISDSASSGARWYLAWLLVPSALFIVSTLVALLVTGEMYTTRAGLEHQLKTGGVYGRSMLNDNHHYKVLLYQQRKPLVLALGSSRTMQFREIFFRPSQRFVTAGGAMQDLEEGRRFIRETFPVYRPQVVIVGLDTWWFNPSYVSPNRTMEDDSKYDSYAYVLAVGVSSLRGIIPSVFAPHGVVEPFSNLGAIGLRGLNFGDGFRPDGSYAPGTFYSGLVPNSALLDPDYHHTLGLIHDELHPFEGGSEVSEDALDQLRGLINDIRAAKARAVLFLPPFSPPIYEALIASPHHGFFSATRSALARVAAAKGVVLRDYSLMPFADRNCYTDGFHGTTQLYAIITRDLIERDRTRAAALDALGPSPEGRCTHPSDGP